MYDMWVFLVLRIVAYKPQFCWKYVRVIDIIIMTTFRVFVEKNSESRVTKPRCQKYFMFDSLGSLSVQLEIYRQSWHSHCSVKSYYNLIKLLVKITVLELNRGNFVEM